MSYTFDLIETCRACGAPELEIVLSLGETPLANRLLTAAQLDEPEPRYPLELAFCPRCTLLQITATVPPEELFREYLYLSSYSDTMVRHAAEISQRLVRERSLTSASLVVEIASNDGYLLQHYHEQGVPVLGIEPAENIARVAREERSIDTLCEFFDSGVAERLRAEGRAADVIHANNVLAHVADLGGVVRGIAALLKPDGVAVIEVPYVKDMIDGCEFDTVYHEHLCYFSLTALDRLFARYGLVISDAERLAIHGGSLRVFACKKATADGAGTEERSGEQSEAVRRLLREEKEWGVGDAAFYRGFAGRVERLRRELVRTLTELKAAGERIAVYGASAKGSTLLNYFGIGRDVLDFVADRSTVKQDRYTPGTHLPIRAPAALLTEMPGYVLLLTWNFAEEILSQQSEYVRRGGRFIIPIPELKIAPSEASATGVVPFSA